MLELIKFFRMLTIIEPTKPLETLDAELLAGITQIIPEEVHGDFLWILILNLLIFIGLTIVSYQASLKIAEATQTTEDPNSLNKLKFIKGLAYANGSKIIVILFNKNKKIHFLSVWNFFKYEKHCMFLFYKIKT